MEEFINKLEQSFQSLAGFKCENALGEVTMTIDASALLDACQMLRDDWAFEQLIDLAGVDYIQYNRYQGPRFAVVYHFLSVSKNSRLRLRVFCPDDDFPLLSTVSKIWPVADWFEREAFDLFGIIFSGHEDLRRILTDYGFIGHPFRKDFPVSGHLEMRYDPIVKRVVYQPVSIEPREVTPRIIREENYGKEKVPPHG